MLADNIVFEDEDSVENAAKIDFVGWGQSTKFDMIFLSLTVRWLLCSTFHIDLHAKLMNP